MANANSPGGGPVGRRLDVARPGQATEIPGKFATISLDDVENMLQETGIEAGPASTASSAPGIPPPLHGAPNTPRPAPVAPVSGTATPSKRFTYSSLVRSDGTLDIDAVYRVGRVPEIAVSAEQLLTALNSLPKELPEQIRQTMLKVTVSSIVTAAKIPLETVVEDARLRRTRLQQFADGLTHEHEAELGPLRREVQELEAMLEAKKAALASRESNYKPLREECDKHIHGLEDVIAVLTAEIAST